MAARKGRGRNTSPSKPKRTRAEIREAAARRRQEEEEKKARYRKMVIDQYSSMSRKEITKLTREAVRGNRYARSKMLQFSWAISTETNKRIDALQKVDKAYGGRYNRLMYFLEIEHENLDLSQSINPNKARTPVQLKLDYYAMRLQNDQAIHWLSTDVSTVEGQISREKHRLAKLHELEIIPSDMDYQESEEFLRWLGSEEGTGAIDEFGTSDQAVLAFWHRYEQEGKAALDLISKSYAEYKANKQSIAEGTGAIPNYPRTFDEAMERAGIKIEDYLTGKGTT